MPACAQRACAWPVLLAKRTSASARRKPCWLGVICALSPPAGLASTALVLSIAAPFGGNVWYGLTAFSPLAGVYYLQKGDRQEEVRVL